MNNELTFQMPLPMPVSEIVHNSLLNVLTFFLGLSTPLRREFTLLIIELLREAHNTFPEDDAEIPTEELARFEL